MKDGVRVYKFSLDRRNCKDVACIERLDALLRSIQTGSLRRGEFSSEVAAALYKHFFELSEENTDGYSKRGGVFSTSVALADQSHSSDGDREISMDNTSETTKQADNGVIGGDWFCHWASGRYGILPRYNRLFLLV